MHDIADFEYWKDELGGVLPPQWMLDCIALNPAYCSWGPHEDCMWKEGDTWESRCLFETWRDFGPWHVNDINECVHFYFAVEKPNTLSLTMWWLHPRKGASRGVEIAKIEEHELPAVFALLRSAGKSNAERFARIPLPADAPCNVSVTFTGKRNLGILRQPLFCVVCDTHGDLTKGPKSPDGYETDDPTLYIRLHLKQRTGG